MTTVHAPRVRLRTRRGRTRRRTPSTSAVWSSPTVSSVRARGCRWSSSPTSRAVLDNWDPRVVDGRLRGHRVITFDNRGVGASTGSTPTTIEQMASDAVAFIRALGFDQVDLFGFSMGGMIAQVIAQQEPRLVRKMILAETGPAGGEGIDKVTRISYLDTARGLLTRRDPKDFLFFTRTPNGRAAREGVPGTARGTYGRPRQGHLRRLVPRPAQGHPPMGSAAARGPRENPPAGARHQRRERQDGAHQEPRRPRSTTPQQPARRLSRRRARRGVPVPRGLRQAGARVPMRGSRAAPPSGGTACACRPRHGRPVGVLPRPAHSRRCSPT